MNDKNIEACTSLKIRFINNRELIKGDVVCGLQGDDGDIYKISTLKNGIVPRFSCLFS